MCPAQAPTLSYESIISVLELADREQVSIDVHEPPLTLPGSYSDDDTISVVAHQGSTQSYSSQRAGTSGPGNVCNSWRSSTSSSTPVEQVPTNKT